MADLSEKKETEVSATPDNKTPEPAKVEKAPTAEEIEVRAKEAMKDWFSNEEKPAPEAKVKFPEEPTEKKEEKKDEQEKPKEEAPVKEEKPEPKPKKKEKAPEPKEVKEEEKPAKIIDEDEAEEIAGRVLDKIEGKKSEVKKEQPKDRFDGATKAERMKLEALEHMGKTWDEYKGRDLAGETLKFWKSEDHYIAGWEKDHPGQKFDPRAEEHREFYDSNEPKVRDDEIVLARTEMAEQRTDSKVEEARRQNDQLRREKEAEQAIVKAAPVIETAAANAMVELVKTVPGFEEIIADQGLTKESVAKLEEENPAAFGFLDSEAPHLRLAVAELEKMRNLGPHYEAHKSESVELPNGNVVEPKKEVINTAIRLERSIQALPEDQQVASGRRFITRAERFQRIQAITGSDATDLQKQSRIQAMNQRFWAIDYDDIKAALIEKSSRRVAHLLEISGKKQKAKAEKPSAEQETAKKETEPKPAKQAPKSVPSIAAESDIVASRVPGRSEPTESCKEREKDWF